MRNIIFRSRTNNISKNILIYRKLLSVNLIAKDFQRINKKLIKLIYLLNYFMFILKNFFYYFIYLFIFICFFRISLICSFVKTMRSFFSSFSEIGYISYSSIFIGSYSDNSCMDTTRYTILIFNK